MPSLFYISIVFPTDNAPAATQQSILNQFIKGKEFKYFVNENLYIKMSDEYDGKKSRFNAGIALTERIDALQRALNAARFNPLSRNMETGTYNYQIMINANDGLAKEAWAKLSPEEQDQITRIKRVIHNFVKTYPPLKTNRNGETIVAKENYEKLLVLLDIYEQKNKELLDEHDLNAPNRDEDDDYDY